MSGLVIHELWESNSGRVCCPDHLGNAASAQRSANPRALGLVTSLDVWRRMSSDDVAEWAEFMAEMGRSVLCEGCRFDLQPLAVES